MSSNYPPGVTGSEPQIAGYPEGPGAVRVRIVLEAANPDGSGFEALDLEDPFGPFTGASGTVALFDSMDAGLRAAGHLAEALAAAVAFESSSAHWGEPGPEVLADAAIDAGAREARPVMPYGGQPCESGLSPECRQVGDREVDAPGAGAAGRLLVCEPCAVRVAELVDVQDAGGVWVPSDPEARS